MIPWAMITWLLPRLSAEARAFTIPIIPSRSPGGWRSSVTTAARAFHKQRILDSRRGWIEILDQGSSRAACCGCYALMKRRYDSFLN